jgi:hypothetical protein
MERPGKATLSAEPLVPAELGRVFLESGKLPLVMLQQGKHT